MAAELKLGAFDDPARHGVGPARKAPRRTSAAEKSLFQRN
jgi:hypothetical protein